jgi:hypothetical protein
MLQLGTVVIDVHYEPPRPVLAPKPWVGGRWINRYAGTTAVAEGLAVARPVRFASSDSQGFVTHAQALALIALYEAGAAFTLTTDLLHPLGTAPVALPALFDPETVPVFTPRTPDSSLYGFDLALIVTGNL